MSAVLLLNLRAPDEGEWLLWDSRVRERGQLGSPDAREKLKGLSRIHPCYVLVPGENVVQLQVTLPVAGSAAQSALPYQIEEKLSADLAEVHVAHDRIRANVPCRVWVVNHDLMAQWHSWLQASGLRVAAVVPDYAALRDNCIVQAEQRMIAHLGTRSASLETALFTPWFSLQHAGDEDNTAVHLCQVGDGEPVISGLLLSHAPNLLEAVATQFSVPENTLCQGRYALHDPVGDALRLLRWPALAAALALVLHWALLAVSALQYAQQADRYDAAADDVYRKTFPGTQRVVNARSQMKSQLNALEGNTGSGGLLPLLTPVAKAFEGQSNISVSQLVYQNQSNNLRLAIDARSYAAIDSFTTKLQGQGLDVGRGTFRQNGEMVSGQLILSRESQ